MFKKETKRLPDAELAVMQIIWRLPAPVTAAQVQENAAQDWKATSVLTFLSRLVDKGFLSCERQGKCNLYTALIDEATYLREESRSLLERLYAGSVKKLVASLADAGAVTDHDLAELRTFLDEQKEE
ncbi:MAG: BlaI/MecI/CopY family transcriptional regulator [Clostridia bacterium]|nr:BlaI/MecI/CopY family transcriptional regulator [Clostridia bacterium]